MSRTHRSGSKVDAWFYDADFLNQIMDEVRKEPFWIESNGLVVPFPSDNSGGLSASLASYFQYALPALGFYNLILGDDGEFVPVHIRGSIVREVNEFYIRNFIKYAFSLTPNGNEVIDAMTIKGDRFFGKRVLTSLRPVYDLKPLKDSRSTSYRFFNNGVVKTKADSIELITYDDLPDGSFVWGNQIINRDFDSSLVDSYSDDSFISDITGKEGHQFHKWVQNLCKQQDDSSKWVYQENKFKTLSSGFGYLLHQYWNEYKCVILVDEDLEAGQANGRTGKSVVLMDALSHALDTVVVDAGAIRKGADNKFLWNFVLPSTQHIAMDDCREDFDFNTLFSKITGPMVCERKYGGMFQFSKNDKPKLSLSSNHPIIGDGSSYTDRQHLCEVGGFYRWHKMEAFKSPDKFHGGYLFEDDWGNQNWQEFDAFCVKSLRYYLSKGLIGGGASSNYALKKLHNQVGSAELVSTLHRFLETNVGEETYQKKLVGMTNEEETRCLQEFVEDAHPEETFTKNKISTSFYAVASYFGFHINKGSDPRPQARFGGKGVNKYLITSSAKPFFKKADSLKVDVSVGVGTDFLDNDSINRVEKKLRKGELKTPPVRASVAVD